MTDTTIRFEGRRVCDLPDQELDALTDRDDAPEDVIDAALHEQELRDVAEREEWFAPPS